MHIVAAMRSGSGRCRMEALWRGGTGGTADGRRDNRSSAQLKFRSPRRRRRRLARCPALARTGEPNHHVVDATQAAVFFCVNLRYPVEVPGGRC